MGGAATKKLTLTLALLLAIGLLPALMTGAQDEPLFHVIPNNNLNLRACGSLDCAVVDQIQAGIRLPVYAVEGEWYQVRSKGRFLWLAGWLTTRTPDKVLETKDDPLFQVTTSYKLIPRACASTQCEEVGLVAAETELSVFAVEDGWYQVLVDGELVWLAGWLTTKLTATSTPRPTRTLRPTQTPTLMPDKILETEEVWYDSNTGCSIGVTMRPGIRELAVALDGERRQEVQVAIFQPGENTPLPVLGSVEKRYSDTGDLYLLQYHTIGGIRWPTGLYRFEVRVGRATSVFGWEMKPANELTFFEVYCDHNAALLPEAGRGPVPTRPAVAHGLTPDKVLAAAEYYPDPRTGCEIRVSDKGGDGDLNLVLTGDRREVVWVNVFRPGENSPLRISGWNRNTFRENGEPFIWQHYGINTPWRDGLYRLQITLDGRTTMLAWRLDRGGDQVIYVRCSGLVPPLTLTPRSLSVADAFIRTDSGELHVDPETGCGVGVAGSGSFSHFGDVFFDFLGDRRKDVKARIYRPGEDFPLRVHERFSSAISYVQHYSLNTVWPNGSYRLEIELDGEILRLDWRKEQAGPLQILVVCDSQHSYFSEKALASLTPRPTMTRRATATLLPTRTAPPTHTSVPSSEPQSSLTEIRTGVVHQDAATGCNVLVLVFPPEQETWKDLWIVRDGEFRHDVWVDISLANSDSPLNVDNEFEDYWDSGEPGVWQTYSPFNDWRDGLYHIELGLHDATSTLTWRMEGPGYYQIHVSCHQPAGPAPSV